MYDVVEYDGIQATNVDFRSQLNDQLVPSWTSTQHVLQASLVPNLVTRRVVAIRPKAAERTLVEVEARLASLPGPDENGKGKGQETRQVDLTLPRTRVSDVARSVIGPRTVRSHLRNEPVTMVSLLFPCRP